MKWFLHIALISCLVTGCNPVTRHKVISTIFDGVPSLPPAAELCREYHEQHLALERADAEKQAVTISQTIWTHAPYEEKKCDDCHDKTKEAGLVKPQRELCFICHEGFASGRHVHGPVAVGECLACHLPHRGNFPALLKADKSKLCGTCHQESRLSPGLHDKVAAKNLDCADCHDPHSGKAQYFLK